MFCGSRIVLPLAKGAGVIVAKPDPLFEKILNSPTVVPGSNDTANAVFLLHIISEEAESARPSADISLDAKAALLIATEPLPCPAYDKLTCVLAPFPVDAIEG